MRITVSAKDRIVVREGHGTGEGRGSGPSEAHDFGLKALRLTPPRGLWGSSAVVRLGTVWRGSPQWPSGGPNRDGPTGSQHPVWRSRRTTTTPISRPSRYYGRQQDAVGRDRRVPAAQESSRELVEAPLSPSEPDSVPGKIDKSVLAIGAPRRLRDKVHLRFVASHSCLVCGRQPADARASQQRSGRTQHKQQ